MLRSGVLRRVLGRPCGWAGAGSALRAAPGLLPSRARPAALTVPPCAWGLRWAGKWRAEAGLAPVAPYGQSPVCGPASGKEDEEQPG